MTADPQLQIIELLNRLIELSAANLSRLDHVIQALRDAGVAVPPAVVIALPPAALPTFLRQSTSSTTPSAETSSTPKASAPRFPRRVRTDADVQVWTREKRLEQQLKDLEDAQRHVGTAPKPPPPNSPSTTPQS